MRVTLSTEGGLAYFPGLARPVTYDSQALPPAQADELRRLVEEAGFFHRLNVDAPPPPGAADYRTYTLTVEDGALSHTVRLTDMTTDPALRGLLTFVQGLRGSAGPSGAPESHPGK